MWSERSIARAIALQTLAKRCVVLVDNCNWTGYECDVLGVTNDLRIIDVEVKISRADLKADRDKDKWWQRAGYGWQHRDAPPVARLHPPKVWKHYYALPKAIWKPELVDCLPSPASGILLLTEHDSVHMPVRVSCVRRATPCRDATRLEPKHVMDIARLATLRMWEAYRREDSHRRDADGWRRQALGT